MPTICIVGLGYIGLPTAVIFARNGFKVVGVDIDTKIVKRINKGEDIIGREDTFQKVIIDKTYPDYLVNNLKIYSDFIQN